MLTFLPLRSRTTFPLWTGWGGRLWLQRGYGVISEARSARWDSFHLVLLDSLSRNPASMMRGSPGRTGRPRVWAGSPSWGPSRQQASATRHAGKKTPQTSAAQATGWQQSHEHSPGDPSPHPWPREMIIKWLLFSAQCWGELVTEKWITGICWGWLTVKALKPCTALALTQFCYLENVNCHKASRIPLSGQHITAAELEPLIDPAVHGWRTEWLFSTTCKRQAGSPLSRNNWFLPLKGKNKKRKSGRLVSASHGIHLSRWSDLKLLCVLVHLVQPGNNRIWVGNTSVPLRCKWDPSGGEKNKLIMKFEINSSVWCV